MTHDLTKKARRAMIEDALPAADLQCVARSAGRQWSTDALRQEFEVRSFLAPFVIVRRKSDGAVGTMEFVHNPRVYFNFQEDK